MTNTSVLQDWLVPLPIRMQSTLILGLRGPDTHNCPEIKKITRWLRGLAFKPGNPDNVMQFMGNKPGRIVEKSPVAKELEFCTQHYYSHLMHALEVVGYNHPDGQISEHAYILFYDMCVLFHLEPETVQQFVRRLETRNWPGGGQPDTFDDAMKLLGEAGLLDPYVRLEDM